MRTKTEALTGTTIANLATRPAARQSIQARPSTATHLPSHSCQIVTTRVVIPTVRIIENVTVTIRIPTSEWEEFNLDTDHSAKYSWGRAWVVDPIGRSLEVMCHCREDSLPPFNKPHNGKSAKGIIERSKMLLRSKPSTVVTFTVQKSVWDWVRKRAAQYGISTADFCLYVFGYYAGLWRSRTKSENPGHPAESFERALAKEGMNQRRMSLAEYRNGTQGEGSVK